MDNRENLKTEIISFLSKKEDRVMFIKGTHQYEKHKELLRVLMNYSKPETKVLLRINGKDNMEGFLNRSIAKKGLNTKIKMKNINLYVDTINSRTWNGGRYNIAIIYPIDTLCRMKDNQRMDIIKNLDKKAVDKLFIVSWTDHYDYSWLDELNIDRIVTFDAKEDDINYHNRVIEIINEISCCNY